MTRIADAIRILKVLIGDQIHDPDHVEVYIRNGYILMHTAGSRGCSGSAPNAAMIHGLFSQKKIKITIDRKLY